MQLNIFRIPSDQFKPLRKKFTDKGLSSIRSVDLDGWSGDFFFSESPSPGDIPWATTFREYLGHRKFHNTAYFAAMMLEKDDSCYVLSFGKSHFYVRPHCDYDFGIELSKRIADEDDISQTSARRFQGKQRKDIRSFGGRAKLNIPPGESVDFLQAKIIPSKTSTYGTSGRFGASAQVAPPIEPHEIGEFLSTLDAEIANAERFKLPRTIVLSGDDEISRYDEKLLDELTAPIGTSSIATETFDLFGVDFVFSSTGSFTLKCGHYKAVDLERLTMKDVKEYIASKKVPREKVLQLRINHRREDGLGFTESIKDAVDYICDDDRVVLSGGKWLKFNQDYLEYLDESIRHIATEETEADFLEIFEEEGDFNAGLSNFGYEVADKDFGILKTSGSTPVEAWDLRKGSTVYAVKFGTPQKLNYVCDQAMNALELIHNRATAQSIPNFDRYCLWLGYRAKKRPKNLADSGSIILKQKVDAWARRCEELGIAPILKLSLKLNPKFDTPANEPEDEDQAAE